MDEWTRELERFLGTIAQQTETWANGVGTALDQWLDTSIAQADRAAQDFRNQMQQTLDPEGQVERDLNRWLGELDRNVEVALEEVQATVETTLRDLARDLDALTWEILNDDPEDDANDDHSDDSSDRSADPANRAVNQPGNEPGNESDGDRFPREPRSESSRSITFQIAIEELLDPIHAPKVRATRDRHPACIGCQNYHGRVYEGNLLVCAMHPYGVESETCPDREEPAPPA